MRSIAVTVPALGLSLVSPSAHAAPTEPGTLVNAFEPVGLCEGCHSFSNSADKTDQPSYAPWAWRGSVMGNSARDPVFWAGIAIAHQDDPVDTPVCVRCHAPRAFLGGRGDAIAMSELEPADLDGIECDFCHRLVEDAATPAGNAQYQIDDVLGAGGAVTKHGPFDYPMGPSPPHDWVADAYTSSARLCGTCHDVTTSRDRLDDTGQSMGRPFNEQRTYSEWLNSAYSVAGPDAKSCQDCHMPPVDDVGACAAFDAGNNHHPSGVRRHDLAGANRRVVELLKGLYGSEGTGDVDDGVFDDTIDRIDEMLASAATLEVVASSNEVDVTVGLDGLTVTVTNETGHKLPTGYSEGRVMWLELIASYAGDDIFTSGKWMPGVGPQPDAQLRTYEGIGEQYSTGTHLHLLLNDHWAEDTRIPPRGLRQDIETDPVGDRYALRADDTWPHRDTVTYAFPGRDDVLDLTPDDPTDDILTVRVRLMYLINTPEYLEFLATENLTNAAGTDVATMFDDIGGPQPMQMASKTIELALVGLGGAADTGTTGEASTSSGTTTGSTDESSGTGRTTGAGDDDASSGGCSCGATDHGHPLLALLLSLPVARRRARG